MAVGAVASPGRGCCASSSSRWCVQRWQARRTPPPAAAACRRQSPSHSAAPWQGARARRARNAGRWSSTCPDPLAALGSPRASPTAGSSPTRCTCHAPPREARARPAAAPRQPLACVPNRADEDAQRPILSRQLLVPKRPVLVTPLELALPFLQPLPLAHMPRTRPRRPLTRHRQPAAEGGSASSAFEPQRSWAGSSGSSWAGTPFFHAGPCPCRSHA